MSAMIAPAPFHSTPPLEFRPILERDLPGVAAIEADVYVYPWTLGNFRDSLLSGYQCIACWTGRELIGGIGFAITVSSMAGSVLSLSGRRLICCVSPTTKKRSGDSSFIETR